MRSGDNDEAFQEALDSVINEAFAESQQSAADFFLAIPGVYEALSDHFNNDVHAKLAEKDGEEPEIHEPECPDDGPCTCPKKGEITHNDGSPGYDHAAGYHD